MNYYSEIYNLLTCFFNIEYSEDQFAWAFVSEHEIENKTRNNLELFKPTILERLRKNNQTRLIITFATELTSAGAVENYKKLLTQNRIPLERVHFIAITEPQKIMVQNTAPEFKVSVFNYWEYVTASMVKAWPATVETALEHKRFLYLNRRFTESRALIYYRLCKDQQFMENSHVSMHRGSYWRGGVDPNHYRIVLRAGFCNHPEYPDLINFYTNNPPLPKTQTNVDPDAYDFMGYENTAIVQLHKQTDLNIIVESHPSHTADGFMPTEKTYRAIAAGQPFVTFGTPGFYSNLANQGYRLQIPEFDHIEDTFQRAEQFVQHVRQIAQIKKWKHYIAEQKQLAEYNRNLLYRRVAKKQIVKNFHSELVKHMNPQLPTIANFDPVDFPPQPRSGCASAKNL